MKRFHFTKALVRALALVGGAVAIDGAVPPM